MLVGLDGPGLKTGNAKHPLYAQRPTTRQRPLALAANAVNISVQRALGSASRLAKPPRGFPVVQSGWYRVTFKQ